MSIPLRQKTVSFESLTSVTGMHLSGAPNVPVLQLSFFPPTSWRPRRVSSSVFHPLLCLRVPRCWLSFYIRCCFIALTPSCTCSVFSFVLCSQSLLPRGPLWLSSQLLGGRCSNDFALHIRLYLSISPPTRPSVTVSAKSHFGRARPPFCLCGLPVCIFPCSIPAAVALTPSLSAPSRCGCCLPRLLSALLSRPIISVFAPTPARGLSDVVQCAPLTASLLLSLSPCHHPPAPWLRISRVSVPLGHSIVLRVFPPYYEACDCFGSWEYLNETYQGCDIASTPVGCQVVLSLGWQVM